MAAECFSNTELLNYIYDALKFPLPTLSTKNLLELPTMEF